MRSMKRLTIWITLAALVVIFLIYNDVAHRNIPYFYSYAGIPTAVTPLPRPVEPYRETNQQVVAVKNSAQPYSGLPLNQARTVNFNISQTMRTTMTARELRNQLLDWMLFTVLSESGMSASQINKSIFDLPVVRYGFTQPLGNFEYDNTRSLHVGNGEVLALVPKGTDAQRQDDLAHVADQHRKDTGKFPTTLHVFEYVLNPQTGSGTLTNLGNVNGADLFTEAAGYYTATINNGVDLTNFLSKIDDVTYATVDNAAVSFSINKNLKLSGRKLKSQTYLGITFDDIAAIWQSHIGIRQAQADFDTKWNAKYAAFSATCPRYGGTPQNPTFLTTTCTASYKQLLADEQADQETQKLVNGSGFSLDPNYDFAGLTTFFQRCKPYFMLLAQGETFSLDDVIINGKFAACDAGLVPTGKKSKPEITLDDINQAETNLAKQDARYFTRLARILSSSTTSIINQQIGQDVNRTIRKVYTFQNARYDGNLKGTEVGMTLFYTDLLAKLWSFNYADSTPQTIPDFLAEPQRIISSLFRSELETKSETRLWFGKQNKGFQFSANSELFFSRNATRIYAAAPNLLQPGVEDPNANMASQTFLGWWNDHYEEIAQYEPQYQRLNEIMKWSLLISWLDHAKAEDSLSFLKTYPVNRTNWFPDWVTKHPELKYQAWTDVFEPNGYLGTSTEALHILYSKPYRQFADEKTAYWTLSGGVSLADVNTFEKLTPIRPDVEGLSFARSDIDYSKLESGIFNNNELKMLDGRDITFSDLPLGTDYTAAELNIAPPEKAVLRDVYGDFESGKFSLNTIERESGLQIESKIGDTPLGLLDIHQTGDSFSVNWQGRDLEQGRSLALAMSKSGSDPYFALTRSPDLEAAMVLPNSGDYVVKLNGSDNWLRISKDLKPGATIGADAQIRAASLDVNAVAYKVEPISLKELNTLVKPENYVLPSQTGVSTITSRGPPSSAIPVKFVSGEITFEGQVSPPFNTLYIKMSELPEAVRSDPTLLKFIASKDNVAEIGRQVKTGSKSLEITIPAEAIADTHEFTNPLLDKDFAVIAKNLAAAPAENVAKLDTAIKQELLTIDGEISAGKFESASAQLNTLIDAYGLAVPDLYCRRALIDLAQNDAESAAKVLNDLAATNAPMKNSSEFFKEVNARLGSSTPAQQSNLYRMAEFADWHSLQVENNLAPDALKAYVENGQLKISYKATKTLSQGEAVAAPSQTAMFYIQDTPSLNNLDWNNSFQDSLNQAVSGKTATVFAIPEGDTSHFQPDKLYAPDGLTAYNRVGERANLGHTDPSSAVKPADSSSPFGPKSNGGQSPSYQPYNSTSSQRCPDGSTPTMVSGTAVCPTPTGLSTPNTVVPDQLAYVIVATSGKN